MERYKTQKVILAKEREKNDCKMEKGASFG